MLQKLRDHAGSWFIKLLFAVLVLSFSLWGIGDVLRNYSHTRPLLSIGSFSVSLEEFARTLRQARSNVQHASTKPLTPEQIKQLDLSNKVLEQFTIQGLIRQEIIAHKLVVTDETLKTNLHSIPTFHDNNHRFNPEYFRRVLQHNHISEAKFISDLRTSLLQTQLLQPFTRAQYLPKPYTKILFRGINQDYVFAVVEIPFNKIPLSHVLGDEVLKTFYEQNRDRFQLPETRSVSLVILDLEHLKNTITLTEERLREEYELRADEFAIPEKRSIEELIVPNEFAEEALERLEEGQSMAAIASNLRGERRNVITITRNELPQDLADAVFADKQVPFITTPLKTSLGTQIIRVISIQPKKIRSFDEIRHELTTTLKEKMANEQYTDMHTKIEDNLAGGSTLKAVAQENNLRFISLTSLNVQGQVAEGKFPDSWDKETRQKAVDLAFATTEGSEAPLTEIANNNAFIVHVDKVTPSHVPDFSSCRAHVVTEWQKDKRYEDAAEMGTQLTKATSLTDFEQQAIKIGFKSQRIGPISRAKVEKDAFQKQRFTETIWRNMFSLRPGKAVSGPNNEGFAVAMLVEIKPYDTKQSQKQYETFEKLLQKTISHDIEEGFINGLRSIYSVEVNNSMLTMVTASETQ